MTSGYSHNRFLSDPSDDVVLTNAGNVNLNDEIRILKNSFLNFSLV